MIKLAVAYGSGELTRVDLKPKKAELLQMLPTATPTGVRRRPAAAPVRKRPAAAEKKNKVKKPRREQQQEQEQSQHDEKFMKVQVPAHTKYHGDGTVLEPEEPEEPEESEIYQEAEDRPAHKACRSRWIVLALSIVCR